LKREESIEAARKVVGVSRVAFEELISQGGFVTPNLLERVRKRLELLRA
jgi:hypothetical protein